MAKRKYPWSKNENRSTEYLRELRRIRKKEGLPAGRIDDELYVRAENEREKSGCYDDDD